MTPVISTELLDQVVAEAQGSPDREVCGLLLGHARTVTAVQPCRNVAADPPRTFEIDPAALLAAHRRARAGGPAILGCYHSHPSGPAAPSPRDAADAAPDGSLWLIVGGGPSFASVTAWRAVAVGQRHGRFDPVPLPCTPDSAPPQGPT